MMLDFLFQKLAQFFFRNNIKQKIAITGTNGKTSISSYVNQIWRKKYRWSIYWNVGVTIQKEAQ